MPAHPVQPKKNAAKATAEKQRALQRKADTQQPAAKITKKAEKEKPVQAGACGQPQNPMPR